MYLRPFALERYFARHEFASRHLLCASDCDGPSLRELLAQADDEVLGWWTHLTLGYTESQGLPALREEIAALYATRPSSSTAVVPDDVLIVVPEEGILLLMLALISEGDHVVCTLPAYQSLYEVARSLGARIDFWKPREAASWHFAVEDLASLVIPGATRLVVINFPHNPTGFVPSRHEFDEMIAVVRDAEARLLSDEMYRGLDLPGTEPLPSAVEVLEGAVCLGGLSKTYGLAGLRLGWLVTRDRHLLARCASLKDYTTICAAAPSEVLAVAALRARADLLPRHAARIAANLERLESFCRRHPDLFQLLPPRAGTTCFPRVLRAEGATALCRTAAQEAGIVLLPSSVYDYGDEHVRIGLGRTTFPEALAAFESFLETHSDGA